jgi:hypothetical protein
VKVGARLELCDIYKSCSVNFATDSTIYGIKIPEIHYQDRKYNNKNIKTITELMKQQCKIYNIKQADSVINECSMGNSRGD